MEVDKSFLESCAKTLKVINSRNYGSILFDHDKEINYLRAKGLIKVDGNNYTVESLGINWLDTFQFEKMIADLESRRDNAATAAERVKMGKKLAAVEAQAKELREYEEKIHHLADQMIAIDLDDGVKHNYAIFKDVLAKIK